MHLSAYEWLNLDVIVLCALLQYFSILCMIYEKIFGLKWLLVSVQKLESSADKLSADAIAGTEYVAQMYPDS